jgi:1-acyl-sn-glycerol-3-phosphate acyltransferase
MRIVLVVIYLFFFFLLGLPVLGVEWLISKKNKYQADISQLRIVQWGFRCILFISGVKVQVYGKENVPTDEAVLYVGNHRSFFDIVATYPQCPGLTGYISKDTIKKVPVLGLWMKRLYCLFIVREDMKQSLKIILTAIEQVKQGISICIFPEGTRSQDYEHPETVGEFKDGSFKIAQKTGCKIVPMAITGTADIFEKHLPWIHKGVVTVTYGKPIQLAELEKEQQKHPGEYVRQVVADMLAKSYSLQ